VSSTAFSTLALIALIAVASPVLADLTGRVKVPSIIFEIGLGIVVGPYVLKLVHANGMVNGLADLGLSFLMFLAGYELDLLRIKGEPLRLAGIGWIMSLGLALILAFGLVSTGLGRDTLIIGLALTTTALGALLPILRDAGALESRFGTYVLAIGTVGEFCPIVAVAILLTKKDPLITTLLLSGFVVIAATTAVLATRPQPPKVVAILSRNLHSSAQLPVRVSVLFILLLVYLASTLGLDVLLGAFAAGVVVRLFTAGENSTAVREKLEAIGFGFLVPVFFVVSGTHFDVSALVNKPSALLRVPLFLALFLVVRGAPALLLYAKRMGRDERIPLALFSATGLPLIVVITTIGTSEGRMIPENAAALVAAGMLSVLLFPMIGFRGLRRGGSNDSEQVVAETRGEPTPGLSPPA
jgi:Kef-type K+ transport system membrane component KefB